MRWITLLMVALFCHTSSASAAVIYLDDFEQFAVGTDLTNLNYMHVLPAVAGTTAKFRSFVPEVAATVRAIGFNGSVASEWDLPPGSGEDYLGRFLTTYTEQTTIYDFDLTGEATNAGFGGFFIRFPTPTLDMQVLMGFLDDGRVVVFNDHPSPLTVDVVGAWVAGTTYRTRLILDQPANTYSVLLNGVPLPLVTGRDIPVHINRTTIHQFGFDSNEAMPTAQGNRYVLDNVVVTRVDAEVPEPATLTLIGLGLFALGFMRRTQ